MKNNEYIRSYTDKELFKRLFFYIKPYLPKFILSLILVLIIVLLDLAPSYIIGEIINVLDDESKIFNNISLDKIVLIRYIILALIFIVFLSMVLNYIYQLILQYVGQDLVYEIRKETFEHIEELSIEQITKNPIGKLVTRVTNDTNALSELFTSVLVMLVRYLLTIIFIYICLWINSPKLTLYVSIVLPFIIGSTILFRHLSRKSYRNVKNSVSRMNSYLSENLSGMKVIQIFNQENKKYNEFNTYNKELRKANISQIFLFSIFRPFMYFLSVIAIIITLYIGSIEVNNGTILLGTLITYYTLLGNFFSPIENLAEQFNTLQASLASCEKIFTNLDTKTLIVDKTDAIEAKDIKGTIEFKNVWFAYNKDEWILKDVSFKVEAGQTCAFVGATGAGKTTILSLICRNYEFQKGEILIDGIDIRSYSIKSLRENIGQMLQDVFLFSGTIRDNITLYDNKYSDEEIMNACKFVNCDRIIDSYSDGLDHIVEERGKNYSQGERQLLSFARTVLSRPNIMILDEATANIDTYTESLIQDSLKNIKSIGTMLVVAHRLSTIQHADKIIVLNHGEVIEEGNHQELLAKKGMYYALYELQYKE